MDEQLMALLEYEDLLGALLTTRGGLVIGAAGLTGDDAETVAAAGSMLLTSGAANGEPIASTDVPGGSLHVRWASELALIVLAAEGVAPDGVQRVMEPVLDRAAGEFAE